MSLFMVPKGGKRQGAGRPLGEPTKIIRAPLSKLNQIQSLIKGGGYAIPVYSSKVQAGFPSPADDYIEYHLDLNTEFIKHPAATFIVEATGESMIEAGIAPGDKLIVDRSLEATDGKIVIAAVNGELTVKRLSLQNTGMQLLPANPRFKPIAITEELDVVIWGVVTLVLHEPK